MDVLAIETELSLIFESPTSFENYYISHLRNKTIKEWEKDLEEKILNIHAFLKGALIGSITADVVNYWSSTIINWINNSDVIKHRLKEDHNWYDMHQDIPEAIFNEDTITELLVASGKSYEELEPDLISQINKRITFLTEIIPFANSSYSVLSSCKSKMNPLILAYPFTTTNKLNLVKNGIVEDDETIEQVPIDTSNLNETFDIPLFYVNKLYNELTNSFIDQISKPEFEKAFKGEPSSVRINWRQSIVRLGYLLKKLNEIGIIQNVNYMKIASGIFTVNNKVITSDKLRTNLDSISRTSDKIMNDIVKRIKSVDK